MNEDMSETSSNSPADSNKMNPVIIGIIVLVIALIGFYALKTSGNQNSATTEDDAMMAEPTMAPTTGGDAMEQTRPADDTVMKNLFQRHSHDKHGSGCFYSPNEIR
jgi:hypothetical protein